MNSLLIDIEHFVKNTICDIATGHDWFHINRVRNNALFLQSKEGGNKEIIELAALLHDISDYKFNGGDDLLGGKIAFKSIVEHGGSEELAQTIQTIVDSISFKGAQVQDTTSSLEAKIVQDADRIDALGAIGIARTFAYGGHVGHPMYDPAIPRQLHSTFDQYKHAKSTTINHFYEKLLLLKDRMHTETAKNMAEERTRFMEQFLEQFYYEWNNEI